MQQHCERCSSCLSCMQDIADAAHVLAALHVDDVYPGGGYEVSACLHAHMCVILWSPHTYVASRCFGPRGTGRPWRM